MSDPLPELDPDLRQHPVLLVDDSLFQRELLCALLQEMGFGDIQHAYDGRQALAMLQRWRGPLPLLVVDLEMPHMDGIELLQRLSAENLHSPVIIASGREAGLISTVEGMLKASHWPLLGSLSKPANAQELYLLLSRYQPRPERVALAKPLEPEALPSESELIQAIRWGHIKPYYQPKVALQTGQLIGYEALARWCTEHGQLSPSVFIALASQYQLLRDLTFSLLGQILDDLRVLKTLGATPCIALNIDISLLADRTFAEQLIQVVQDAGTRPDQWMLEVTESALMHDPAVTLGSVGRLRLAGFGLSIDDYGTGFSTLQQLARLPFTELKIDRAFIAEAQHNSRAQGILRAAIETGRTLNLPCVAEGIEYAEDARLLASLGCYAGQGYLFARAMPFNELRAWHFAHNQVPSLQDWFTQ